MRSRSAGAGKSADALSADSCALSVWQRNFFVARIVAMRPQTAATASSIVNSDGLRGIGRMASPRAVARLTSMLNQVRQPIRVEPHGGRMPVMRQLRFRVGKIQHDVGVAIAHRAFAEFV